MVAVLIGRVSGGLAHWDYEAAVIESGVVVVRRRWPGCSAGGELVNLVGLELGGSSE
ncbi:MAG: hypothetical protein M3O28_04000 [Actinomycetota bacterium]|nr:hypothetical protein [Actinomycetota bacterium]